MIPADRGLRGTLLSSAEMALGLDSGLLATADLDPVENTQALMSDRLKFKSWVSHLLVGALATMFQSPPAQGE